MKTRPLEPELISNGARVDTRASWRLLTWVGVIVAAIYGGIGGVCITMRDFRGAGDDREVVAAFEQQLDDLANHYKQPANDSTGLVGPDPVVEARPYDPFTDPRVASLSLQKDALDRCFNDLTAHANKEKARALYIVRLAQREDGNLPSAFQSEAANAAMPWILRSPESEFLKWCGGAVVGALLGAIFGWLVVTAIGFVWWFLMQRLRDVASAVRGNRIT